MIDQLMIVEYKSLNLLQQEQFKNIYLNAFPANERRPVEQLLIDLNSGNYSIYLYLVEEKVVAIASIYTQKNHKLTLLDYFAVEAEQRGKGLGGVFFRGLVEVISGFNKTLLLEVEDPAFGGEFEQKKKRVQFYQKNGAALITNYNYILPDLDGMGQRTPMKIMIAPASAINSRDLEYFISGIFENLYFRSKDDQIYLANLENIPDELFY
jgi:GNAT superfamily N-acetyltransferase